MGINSVKRSVIKTTESPERCFVDEKGPVSKFSMKASMLNKQTIFQKQKPKQEDSDKADESKFRTVDQEKIKGAKNTQNS